jgi:hypothetical protein
MLAGIRYMDKLKTTVAESELSLPVCTQCAHL